VPVPWGRRRGAGHRGASSHRPLPSHHQLALFGKEVESRHTSQTGHRRPSSHES
jgi:hypothetical protein